MPMYDWLATAGNAIKGTTDDARQSFGNTLFTNVYGKEYADEAYPLPQNNPYAPGGGGNWGPLAGNLFDVIQGAPGGFGDYMTSVGGKVSKGVKEQQRIAAWKKRRNYNRAHKLGRFAVKGGNKIKDTGGGRADPLAAMSESAISAAVGGAGWKVPNVDARVKSIVDSLIASEESQKRAALGTIRQRYQRAGQAAGSDALAYDKIARILGATGDMQADKSLQSAEAVMKQIQAQPKDTSGASEVSSAQLSADRAADVGGAVGLTDMLARQKSGDSSYFKGLRGLRQLKTGEDIASLRADRASAMSQAESDFANQRSNRIMKSLEVEQALKDMAIKEALANQQVAGATEDVINKRFSREQAREQAAMARKEFNFKRKQYQRGSSADKQNLVNEILYGKTEKQKVPVYDENTGKTVYQEQFIQMGAPGSRSEAQQMLIQAGVPHGQAASFAKSWWEQQVKSAQSDALGAISTVPNNWTSFGG